MIFGERYYKLPNGKNATIASIDEKLIIFSINEYLQKCTLIINENLSYFTELEKSDFTFKLAIDTDKYLTAMQGNISVTNE